MRYRVDLRVHFDGAFNVGAGAMGGSPSPRPMLTDWQGLPVVPASSLKGRLRHTCKQLAEALGQKTCDAPVAEKMCPFYELDGDEEFCPICCLFGSPWLESHLTFTDLTLKEPVFLVEGRIPPRTSLRYGVGLSRHRRVAQDKLLYTSEVFLPGSTVTLGGEIHGWLDREEDLGLLVAGLENLVALGGSKSTGMGWCDLEFEIYRLEEDDSETLLAAEDLRRRWVQCTPSA